MADPPKKRSVTMTQNDVIAPEVNLLHFGLPPGDAMHFLPGQFVTFYVAKNGATVTRSYSISSSADQADRFDLCIKKVDGGYVSTYLCGLAQGSELRMMGPLGRFLLKDPGSRSVLFVCTGTGIAPFIPMTESLLSQKPDQPTWLFFGTRHEEDLLFRKELETLCSAHTNFHYVPVLSRPESNWSGATGHVEGALEEKLPDLTNCDVYICGVPGMVADVQALAEQLHCPKDHTFVERY